MAEIKLFSGKVPAGTPYPGDFNSCLESLSSYLSVSYPEALKYIVVSSSAPGNLDQDKIWFKVSPQTGLPVSINLFVNGYWVEFSQLTFGDMVLVNSQSVVVSPWGEPATVYTVSGKDLTTPAAPTAPTGFKYKVYVGYYE